MYNTEDEAIAAAVAEMGEGELIEFDGMDDDCNDNGCGGWDGKDGRCDCGNRRVYWSTFKNGDGTFTAFATAD